MKRLPLSLEPEAEADLLEAYEWYEKRREGLGSEFMECVDDALERISRQPELHALGYRGVRQTLIKRFPYVVCFLLEEEAIAVVAVFHGRRDPSEWQVRVE
jgi:plasmid stabilization system protein ParE